MVDIDHNTTFFDVDLLQKLQDHCSRALGIACVTVDYKGTPITRESGFSVHCQLGRNMSGFCEQCYQCDAHGGLHSAITGKPYIYRCHAGAVDVAVPLVVNNSYIGAVLGGQVRLKDDGLAPELEQVRPYSPQWHDDNPDLAAAYKDLRVISYEQLNSAVELLWYLMKSFMENQYNEYVTTKLTEENRKLSKELELQKQQAVVPNGAADLKSFFFIMNVISKLAYEEKAPRTETAVYDFADMVRHGMSAERKISTVGEEIAQTSAYLRIMKEWFGDRLKYSISIPPRYHKISCPLLLLQPIVARLTSGLEEGSLEPVSVEVHCEATEYFLLVHVISSDKLLTAEILRSELTRTAEGPESRLCEVDKKLRRQLGTDCAMAVAPRRDGTAGVDITFKLPIEGGAARESF